MKPSPSVGPQQGCCTELESSRASLSIHRRQNVKTRWMASQKQLGPSTPKATVASILDCSICPGPHPPRPMSRANFVKLNGIKISCLVMPRREPPPPRLPFPHSPLGARPSTSVTQRLCLPLCTLGRSLHLAVFFCTILSSGPVKPMQAACWHLRAWGH